MMPVFISPKATDEVNGMRSMGTKAKGDARHCGHCSAVSIAAWLPAMDWRSVAVEFTAI
jgi:hypothetical protein